MDVKLVVLRVRVRLVISPHRWDSSIRHHPVPPQAEGAPGATACLQRRELNESARAQLQQQEDAGEGGDDGHAAEHGDGDGKLGHQLEILASAPLSLRGVFGGLPHVLGDVYASARERIQGVVRGAGQAGLGAEAAAGQAGLRARQAGWDGSWRYRVPQCVVDGLAAHRKAWRTFLHTALLKEVVPSVALWNTGGPIGSACAQEAQTLAPRGAPS